MNYVPINEALNEMNENLEKLVEQRTQKLKQKNDELILYSFTYAHKVRGPLTRIMGLVNLTKTHKSDLPELLDQIEDVAHEMDEITRSIGEQLNYQISKK